MQRIIAPLIFLLASIAVAQTSQPTVKLAVTTQPLGQSNKLSAKFKLAVSRDNKRLGLFLFDGQQVAVILDGKPLATHEWVVPNSGDFTEDSKTLVYIAQQGPEMAVCVNGKPLKGYYEVLPPVAASVDGSHLAYVAREKTGKRLVVFDGVESARFDEISSLVLSQDAKRIAYIGRRDGVTFLVDGTTETRVDSKPFDPAIARFGAEGKRLAFMYEVGSKVYLRVDGQPFGPYEGVRGNPVIAYDGTHWAIAAKLDGKWSATEDGKPIATADDIAMMGYLENPIRLRYVTLNDKVQRMVIDGKVVATLPEGVGFLPISPHSPDYQRLAYPSRHSTDEQFIVVDGKEQATFKRVVPPIFSKDSKHVGYIASKTGNDVQIVVDGVIIAALDNAAVSIDSLIFSPDGKHVAWLATPAGQKPGLYVDNVRGPSLPEMPKGSRITFDDDATLRILASDNDYNVFTYVVKIQPN